MNQSLENECQRIKTNAPIRESFRKNLGYLLRAKGIDLDTLDARQQSVAVTLDFTPIRGQFPSDDAAKVHSPKVADFVSSWYPGREVSIDSLRYRFGATGLTGLNMDQFGADVTIKVSPQDGFTQLEVSKGSSNLMLPGLEVARSTELEIILQHQLDLEVIAWDYKLTDWMKNDWSGSRGRVSRNNPLDPKVAIALVDLLITPPVNRTFLDNIIDSPVLPLLLRRRLYEKRKKQNLLIWGQNPPHPEVIRPRIGISLSGMLS